MKRISLILVLGGLFLLAAGTQTQAGEVDVLVQKLVEKNILSPAEAQIIIDETKLQVSKDLAQSKSLSVPEWTQRIKWGGDVRYRTQGDWAKKTINDGKNSSYIEKQQIRNRIRGRFYMEGKVNDFTYAGVRFAGGKDGSRSTNDTIGSGDGSYFRKWPAYFDQYYMRFEAPSEIIRNFGKYFSDLKLWAGRFNIPFEYSELVWDSDINPGGLAIQYVSPDIKTNFLPDLNVYTNAGMFWLDEASSFNSDSMLWGWQGGVKTAPFGPLDTTLNASTSIYDFANMQNKTPGTTAGTNSRVINPGAARYRYGYSVFDLLIQLDNSKIMDFEFPHGFYGDFIYNPSAPTLNQGALLGAYVGKKKLKVPGDWKARAEWRYIERDSIPDFMPDSDFYGFGTWVSPFTGVNAGANGLPAEGGTNSKGINLAFEYQLLKNTVLNLEYYWMKPIKSYDKTNPWNEFQFDIVTKF